MTLLQPPPAFNNLVEGTWGEFHTPSGHVTYLLTSARLGAQAPDPARRLTSFLRPVREILAVEDLQFSEILQRNLDDHRVAQELIPYVLEPNLKGPAFFPPIVVALLPFEGDHVAAAYPASEILPSQTVGSITMAGTKWGSAFQFRYLVDGSGQPDALRFGRLEWNDEAAKLMVLDGQHRAMALLAIDRTLRDKWDEAGRGQRYRHFYERSVRNLMREGKVDLENLRFPVTLIWFKETLPQAAARKLFIDVNKQARKPSESRLILLSDSELVKIFSRSLLEQLRDEGAKIPLAAVEYDNSSPQFTRTSKWSALTNLAILQEIVDCVVFGPVKLFKDMAWFKPGRPNQNDRDLHFQFRSMKLDTFLPTDIELPDGGKFARSALNNEAFPPQVVPQLTEKFLTWWGHPLLSLLAGIHPYREHCGALGDLDAVWQIEDDLPGALAKEAAFEGSGLFWTLKSARAQWDAKRDSEKPQAAEAYDSLERRRDEFSRLRASRILGKEEAGAVCDDFMDQLRTFACQLGLALAFATLSYDRDEPETNGALAENLVEALNASLMAGSVEGEPRVVMFSKKHARPVIRSGSLNTSSAKYFRYFWLELLLTPEAAEHLPPLLVNSIHAYASLGRVVYLKYLAKEFRKLIADDLKRQNFTELQIAEECDNRARVHLAVFLQYWYGYDTAKLDATPGLTGVGALLESSVHLEEDGLADFDADNMDEDNGEDA